MRLLPEEGWQRNQLVVTAMVFVVFTGFAFVLPFLPLYVRQLGVRGEEAVALWAGVLIGVAPLLAGLLAPVWGRLADRHGHKPMAVRALAAYVVLLLLSAVATNVWQLFALRVGIGLFGGVGPLGLAMATSLAPREHTGRAVGLVQSAQILAAAVGPFTGGYLADWIGIPKTFAVTALLCAVALWLVMRYYQESPAQASAAGTPSRPVGEMLRMPGLIGLLVVLFLVNFVGRSFTPILPLYLPLLGVATGRLASATGILISAYSMTAALSAAALGRASQSHSPRTMLVASLVAGAATVLPMALVRTFPAMLLLALLLGLVSGGALTLAYTIGGLTVPEAHRATAFGFFSAAALFGGAISPSVAGLLVHWDLRGIYYVDTAIFAMLAVALLPAFQAAAPAVSRAGDG
jgi:DHA1 family multidrug resistance protein-like MFS transporter